MLFYYFTNNMMAQLHIDLSYAIPSNPLNEMYTNSREFVDKILYSFQNEISLQTRSVVRTLLAWYGHDNTRRTVDHVGPRRV